MKKQVLSFCALFGLVLVLSVYYVLLPSNLFVESEVNNNINESLEVNVTIQEASDLFFSELDNKLTEKHQKIIYEYESKVANQNIANEEKEVALNMIYNQQKIIDSEERLVGLIKEIGYYNAYVEYLDDMIKVIVQAETLSNQQAAELISLIIDNSINGLLPEVSYV